MDNEPTLDSVWDEVIKEPEEKEEIIALLNSRCRHNGKYEIKLVSSTLEGGICDNKFNR